MIVIFNFGAVVLSIVFVIELHKTTIYRLITVNRISLNYNYHFHKYGTVFMSTEISLSREEKKIVYLRGFTPGTEPRRKPFHAELRLNQQCCTELSVETSI